VLVALRGYKILLSPLFAGSCRFTPSCADYAAEAVRLHGSVAGLILGLKRLGRCHPLGSWGFDPVPAPAGKPASQGGRERQALGDSRSARRSGAKVR